MIACAFIFYINNFKNRHPKTTGRPSFASLHHKLSRPESLLLKWTDQDGDKTRDPQSTMLGALLETASDLHSDLQHKYVR